MARTTRQSARRKGSSTAAKSSATGAATTKGSKTQQQLSFGGWNRVTKAGGAAAARSEADKKASAKAQALEKVDFDAATTSGRDSRADDSEAEGTQASMSVPKYHDKETDSSDTPETESGGDWEPADDSEVSWVPRTASRQSLTTDEEVLATARTSATTTTESKHDAVDDVGAVSGVQGLVGGQVADLTSAELAIRVQARQEEREPVSKEEEAASRLPEAQIKRYWRAKEQERLTPRVHQAGLSLHEKVLREFDMSSQFGTCTGIPRTRRWKLAHELGLNPPIEVLAVLMKEDARKDPKVQRAYVDELLSSRYLVE